MVMQNQSRALRGTLVLFGLASAASVAPACVYDGSVRWTTLAMGVFGKPCRATDDTQRWAGLTLTSSSSRPSTLTNAGAPNHCLDTLERDPIMMGPCGTARFLYNQTNKTIAVIGNGLCIDVNHGTGPAIDFYACHTSTSPDVHHQQFNFDESTSQIHLATNKSLCLSLNRTMLLPYIEPPCIWPSVPPATNPFKNSDLLQGITVLENATAIPGYGADTWYPAEDRHGNLFSGFDDGAVNNVSVGSACTRPPAACRTKKYGFHTGSAVVAGSR
jgi:hypothetical protein